MFVTSPDGFSFPFIRKLERKALPIERENLIEKRGAGSPCGSLFSTVDDEFVPEIQAVYARAA